MTREEITSRKALATELHQKGFNCGQSVACAFSDKTDIDNETIFRMTEGLGMGMGCMEGTCGAIAAAALLSGVKCSTCNLENPDSKAVTYRTSKSCLTQFKEKNGSVICRELKGVDTGKVLRSCPDCITDAVEIIAETLYAE